MCGICGIYNFDNKEVSIFNINKMNDEMISRGPDSSGAFVKNNFGFGMRRLSIIDIAGGSQPMFSEDQKISIIFNGEIFNFIELKKDLEKKGMSFKTNSDTEVILKLYEQFDENFVSYLRGMFAICIYDQKKNKIIIIRDRFGIKPLYFYNDGNSLFFSSDLNSIAKILGPKIKISDSNFILYCLFNYFPKTNTVYNKVSKLLPGHKIVIENNQFKIEKYWELKISEKNIDFQVLKDLVYQRLINTAKIHLRSDVGFATLLSSGIDSSILAYLNSQIIGKQLTLSVNYEGKKIDETIKAENFSKFIGSEHYSFLLREKSFFEYFEMVFNKIDEPNADTALISSYLLSQEAKKKGIKVLISGAGADEIFGGYSRFFKNINHLLYGILNKLGGLDYLIKIIPYKLQNIYYKLFNQKIALVTNYSGQNFGVLDEIFQKKQSQFLINYLEKVFLDYNNIINFESKKIMFNDISNYLPDNILSVFDKATMLNSVEGRVPYLDHQLAELIFEHNLGKSYFKNFSNNKKILREIFKNKIPDYVFNNPKIGFNAPINHWKEINSNYFNTNKIHEFLEKNIKIEKIKKNLKNNNFVQLIYSLNSYNKWLNSRDVYFDNNSNI